MRFLIVGALMLAASAPIAAARPVPLMSSSAQCPDVFNRASGQGKAEVRKLGELPPANAYRTVYRLGADGCVEPVIAGYGYGSKAGRRSPMPGR